MSCDRTQTGKIIVMEQAYDDKKIHYSLSQTSQNGFLANGIEVLIIVVKLRHLHSISLEESVSSAVRVYSAVRVSSE